MLSPACLIYLNMRSGIRGELFRLMKDWGTRVTKKILVADDEVTIAELLEQSLIEEGYEVQKSIQSLRFYDAVREYRPDLILLDLMMPYLEGEDELRLMKLSPDTAHIPVIVVTAKADVQRDEARLRELGVLHIVKKPFDLNQLLQLVKQTLGS
jgi:DNA-binding response OmpR family regulator